MTADTEELETNKTVALRFLDLAFSMRMDEAISLLSDDASWWVIGDPTRIRVAGHKNRTQTVRMMRNMHKVLPDGMRYQVIGVTAERDRVAAEVEAEGRWIDGTPYRNSYHFLLVLRDSKVTAIREYMDTMQVDQGPARLPQR